MTVKELQAQAKELRIKGYSKMKKDDLIKAIEAAEAEAVTEADLINALVACGWTLYGKAPTSVMESIIDAMAESKVQLLDNSHVTQGTADYAIGVFVGGKVAATMPINAHGTRIDPSSLFGDDPTDYAAMWAWGDPTTPSCTPIKCKGDIYGIKTTRKGDYIGRKWTMRKYVEKLFGGCFAHYLYGREHMTNVDWTHARNATYRVRLVKDLEIIH